MVNWDELDRILDTVEEALLPLAGERKLHRTSIERWRWDEPAASLTWCGRDCISRNINALITRRDPSLEEAPLTLKVEVNARQDEALEEKKMRVRHWQHKKVGRLPIPLEESQLREMVERGYAVVSSWSRKDLVRRKQLTSPSEV